MKLHLLFSCAFHPQIRRQILFTSRQKFLKSAFAQQEILIENECGGGKASINKYFLSKTDLRNNLENHTTLGLTELLIRKHRKVEASYSHIQYD